MRSVTAFMRNRPSYRFCFFSFSGSGRVAYRIPLEHFCGLVLIANGGASVYMFIGSSRSATRSRRRDEEPLLVVEYSFYALFKVALIVHLKEIGMGRHELA